MEVQKPIIALVFAALGASVMLLSQGNSPTSTPLIQCDACEGLRSDFQELIRTIQATNRQAEATADPTRVEAGEEGSADDLAEKLDLLNNTVAHLVDEINASSKALEEPPRQIPPNSAAISDAATIASQDIQQDRSTSFFAWSPHAVYRRFGTPDIVFTSGQSTIVWEYLNGERGKLSFIFQGGLVTKVDNH